MKLSLQGPFDYLDFSSDFDGDPDACSVNFPAPLFEALVEVNKGRVTFRCSNEARAAIGDRFETHADRHVVEEWLSDRGYSSDDLLVIYWLSVHVLSDWSCLPKRAGADHRKLYSEIEMTAKRLADLIEATGSEYHRAGGYGLINAYVSELLTDSERQNIIDPLSQVVSDTTYIFPTFEDLLYRIGEAASRLKRAGPIHSQPRKRGALNGYFIRRIQGLLLQRYGEVPTKVLAAIATIALNEPIDDDLTAKHTKLSERSKAK